MTRWMGSVWGVALLAVVMVAGCDRGGAPAGGGGRASAGRPVIVASIFPLADLTRRIVGDAAEVRTFMPPGTNPHHFAPTPAQLVELNKAGLLVGVGLHLDDWALKPARQAGVETALFADLVGFEPGQSGGYGQVHAHGGAVHSHAREAGHSHGGHDGHEDEHEDGHGHDEAHGHADHDGHDHHDHAGPNQHLWLDPQQTLLFVNALGGFLAGRHPEHAEAIRQNTRALADEIAAVDHEYRTAALGLPEKKLVTFHNAFDLPAARYGLEVVAHLTPIELSPGGEVTPARLVEAIKAIKAHGLKTVYAEPQFPAAVLQRLHEETGVAILTLDPEGNPDTPGYDSWTALMRSNLATLVKGQGKRE